MRLARLLRRHMAQRRWLPSSDASVEKAVMLGFYAIRKMLESFDPVPVESEGPLSLTTFRRNRSRVSPLAFPDVSEAFDLTGPKMVELELREVCNQIIHSHFFSLWLARDQALHGVFFCSDRNWKEGKEVYRLDIEAIVTLFERIAKSRRKYVSLRHFYPENNRIVM